MVFSKRELSESAVILVAMPTGMGETLQSSPRHAQSFRIKRCAFRLVPPDGGLLVVSSSDCDFSTKVQPILQKFTVLETAIQGLH